MLNDYITFEETEQNMQLKTMSQTAKAHPKVGEYNKNKYGTLMTIMEYFNYNNITIMFTTQLSTGEIYSFIKYNQSYQNFKKGELKSPYDCTAYGIGYLGVGPYTKSECKKYYSTWQNMLTRCYNEKSLEIRPGYRGCYVDPFFHNFQNFCYWCDMNYYEVPGETMCLDKDILYYNNNVYGPMTCVFVPQTINKLFTYDKSSRQIGNPVGVSYHADRNKKYEACCSINGKNTGLGFFYDKMQAFAVYKEAKEKEIKRIAEQYRPYIPELLYYRMINYIVIPDR